MKELCACEYVKFYIIQLNVLNCHLPVTGFIILLILNKGVGGWLLARPVLRVSGRLSPACPPSGRSSSLFHILSFSQASLNETLRTSQLG